MALQRNMVVTQPTNQNLPTNQVVANPPAQISYQQWGFQSAAAVDGSPNALMSCLGMAYRNARRRIETDVALQTTRKTAIQIKIDNLDAQVKVIDTDLDAETERLNHEESNIERLKKEIDEIKENPKAITGDSFVKASFWIGTVIISFLTLYLFIFYSSAAYSAFFKIFTPDDTNIVSSIFDAQAFSKAFKDGFTELIFIFAIPAVFLGLGFLIHKFQEQKDQEQKNFGKYFKITGLIITTFIFDFIIAYEITEKIYNIGKEGSFEPKPDMTVSMALHQINFWLIIFAGFIVYIIWGFVFDFVMKEYEKLDRVNYAIKTRKNQIGRYKTECKRIKEIRNNLQKNKNIITGNINQFKTELSGIIIFFSDVNGYINEFFAGWISYMTSAGKPKNEIDGCTVINDFFIDGLKNNTIVTTN
ncbi:MAG: hypothetical protein LBT27_00110 [Prevotellaceae bacterium]|jgi:hypothetical protein|nr:hypothetical protein [Prevotellaceae bacterium]